jgi:hypothetical protein
MFQKLWHIFHCKCLMKTHCSTSQCMTSHCMSDVTHNIKAWMEHSYDPPNSQDLGPSLYHLFRTLKDYMWDWHYKGMGCGSLGSQADVFANHSSILKVIHPWQKHFSCNGCFVGESTSAVPKYSIIFCLSYIWSSPHSIKCSHNKLLKLRIF